MDPGGTTGFACYDGGAQYEAHQAWEVAGQFEACQQVNQFLSTGTVDVLVCESFAITLATLKKTRDGSNMAIEIIGTARWLCHQSGVTFVEQAPANAAMFSTPEKLRAIGWWTVGSDHARSASKHLLLYLCAQRFIDPARLLTSEA